MSDGACRNSRVVDAATAVIFVVADLLVTLAGATWWPSHPGTLAWTMLVLQAVAGCALFGYRRFPLTVVGIIGGYTLALTLLISPAGALTPAHDGRMWAPYATVVAAYAPMLCGRIRRRDVVALVALTVVVARPWDPSVAIIAIGLARTAIGPLLALFFAARRRLIHELTERAERAERERHLLAEQARAEERARLAGEMHDVVTHRVSLMVLQAGALQMTAADPETRRGGYAGGVAAGRRPDARLAAGRPYRLPGGTRGADECAQARPGRGGGGPGALRQLRGTADRA